MGEVKRYDPDSSDATLREYVGGEWVTYIDYATLEAERDALAAEKADCEKFLKEGERLDECLERWRADALAVLELLTQEKVKSESLAAENAKLRAACAAKDAALEAFDADQCPHDMALEMRDAALSDDAGKNYVDASGAVEATCFSYCEVIGREPFGTYRDVGRVEVPKEWAGSRVLIVRVAK